MAFTTSVKTKGGKKIKAIMAKAEQNRGKKIKVGFFSASAYPDGTKTALVAAAQEFGLAGLPERPFFRQAIAIIGKELPRQLRGIINPETMEISAGRRCTYRALCRGHDSGPHQRSDRPQERGRLLSCGRDQTIHLWTPGSCMTRWDYEAE